MFKHILAFIVLSILIVVGISYAQIGLQALLSAHDWIADTLRNIFSGGEAGEITRQLIALLAIPLLVGLIPSLIYWFAKRKWLPCFMEIVWVAWLIQTSALVVLYKSAA
jgi:hypothetical protein